MIEQAPNAEAVFLAALEKATPQERVAYAEGVCSDRPELWRRVQELLAAHDASHGPLDAPPKGGATIDQPPTVEKPGLSIGPYKLLQQIGAGGMGVVYMAEQQEPVRRMVALKIIKPGMDSGQVLARFEAELQALALMDHPNIAKVFDAGATADGRPFFVMELVKGTPITAFCDANKLSTRQRLELFVPVCQAIQHAHQKGVIHRDIKPSNVLIALYDDKPVPKVIDFGIAKAAGNPLTERTLHTGFGAIVGTPEYMSPEQATFNQLDIDTRSDIYSLGVLLYELLTGLTPVDKTRFKEAAILEMLRVVREEEPPPPSVKLSTAQTAANIAATRGIGPEQLARLLRGELDWIVMKSLEKERNRRYETAAGLARDVDRYLNDEIVEARPPSLAYRLRKNIRRNRGLVIAASAVLLAVALGICGTTWGWVEAIGQRDAVIAARINEAEQRTITINALTAQQKAEENARIAAEKQTAAEKKRADEAMLRGRAAKASRALERGGNLLERGEVGNGLLWLVQALEEAPPDDLELNHSLRRLLAGWYSQLEIPRAVLDRDDISDVVFSPDGKTFATANGSKGMVQFWDVKTAQPVGESVAAGAAGPDGSAAANACPLAFSADGRKLLILRGYHARVWDRDTGKLEVERIPKDKNDHLLALNKGVFSPDGKSVLLTDGVHGPPTVWSTQTGMRMFELPHEGRPVLGAAFTVDGKAIITADPRGIYTWNAQTGKSIKEPWLHKIFFEESPELKKFVVEKDLIRAFAASGDGKHIAIYLQKEHWILGTAGIVLSQMDGARLKVVGGNPVIGTMPLPPQKDIRQLEFNTDGTKLVTVGVGVDQTASIRAWNLRPNKARRPFQELGWEMRHGAMTPWGPGMPQAAVHPAGTMLATANGTCLLWDLPKQRSYPYFRMGNFVTPKMFIPKSKTLIAWVRDDKGESWYQWFDLAAGKPLGKIKGPGNGALWNIACSPDGLFVAVEGVGQAEKEPRPMELRHSDGKLVGELPVPPGADGPISYQAVSFSADGKSVMAIARSSKLSDVKLYRWDSATRKLQEGRQLKADMNFPSAYRFSPRGKYYYRWNASPVLDHSGQVFEWWDAATGAQAGRPIRMPPGGAVFSPDEKLILILAQGSRGVAEVRIWDAATGQAITESKRTGLNLQGVPLEINGFIEDFVCFAPDGKTFAIFQTKGVQFWDTATFLPVGEELTVLERPGTTTAMVFAPDGGTVALGGRYGDDEVPEGGLYLVPAPRPLDLDPEHIRLRVEVATWRTLEGDALTDLDAKTWRKRFRRLQELGGPPTP